MRPVFPSMAILSLVTIFTTSSASSAVPAIVRETRTVVVHGVPETWQLVWIGKPISMCGPRDVDMATTCPCAGTAYGEAGNLWLVRRRGGREIERMDLKPLFGHFDYPDADRGKDKAILQRWPMKDSDWKDLDHPPSATTIERRPPVHIMKMADYDHDGHATEFLLQVGTLPCGKLQSVAIGLTQQNPHLHALSTVERPGTPLMMSVRAWQALLKSPGPTTVDDWDCGDHASEEHDDLVVSARHGDIHVKFHRWSCPTGKEKPKLIQEGIWPRTD
jgi:hypothetical protein